TDRAGEAGQVCAVASGLAVVIDRDQAQEPGEDVGGAAAGGRRGLGQGGVGLTAERAADPTESVVAFGGQLAAASDADGELVEDVGQQGQGLAAASVGHHAGDQLVADVDAGVASGPGDDQGKHVPGQRPDQERGDGQAGLGGQHAERV